MLSQRLEKILKLINDESNNLADIGTDHGKLPIAAVQRNLVKKAYAVDLRPNPLSLAQKNINQAKLSGQIETILADGLDFLSTLSSIKIDYCVIAGLGTKTILEILKKDSPQISNYLICANNQVSELRKWANYQQYTISYEEYLTENKRDYWILGLDKNQPFKLCENEEFGDWSWHQNNYSYQIYLQNLVKHQQKLVTKIDDEIIKTEFLVKIAKIQEYLRLWN